MGAGVRREPHQRHDRSEARLGDLAPARLGRADHRVRAQGHRRGDPVGEVSRVAGADGAHPSRRCATKGADAWFEAGAQGALPHGLVDDPAQWEQVTDILDVWFDSGSTHAFTLEDPSTSPASPASSARRDGGNDRVMYLEGSDQHRGWFQSSLLESCGTRGRAPFDVVLTHGFVLDEKGQKMSKSVGNVVAPQDVMKTVRRRHPAAVGGGVGLFGRPADRPGDPEDVRRDLPQAAQHAALDARHARPLRGAAARSTLSDDARAGAADAASAGRARRRDPQGLRRVRLQARGRPAVAVHEHGAVRVLLRHPQGHALLRAAIRASSARRRSTVVEQIFRCTCAWLAPILSFTAEEAWLARYPCADGSVHLEPFPTVPAAWRDDALAAKWEKIRRVRRVVTGALELERAAKRIGSSLEAAPVVHITDAALARRARGRRPRARCASRRASRSLDSEPPAGRVHAAGCRRRRRRAGARDRHEVRALLALHRRRRQRPGFPELSARDAAAVRELDARQRA